MFKFNVNLTEQDYYKFNNFNNEESKFGKKLVFMTRIFFLILYFITVSFFINKHGVNTTTFISLIPMFIIGVLFIVFIKRILRFFNKRGTTTLEKMGKKLYSPVSTVEFSDEYVLETTPETETKLNYTVLENAYIVRNEDVYIYINIQQVLIIPRKCFDSQEQWDSFLEFIKSKLDEVIVIE